MDGLQLADEMKTYLADENNTSEDTALPFETLDDYSTDPVNFNEMSLLLLKKVEVVFDYASKYNRHSSQYLKSCVQLEKGIKYLGSCCLTKRALENETKQTFPDLGQLTTEKLYRMASVHYRKIDRALSEYIAEKDEINGSLLEMEFRYFNLLRRLRSTEVKIYNYQIDSYYTEGRTRFDPVKNGLSFSEKSWSKEFHEHEEAPVFGKAKAFPQLTEFSGKDALKAENRSLKAPAAAASPDEGSNENPSDPAEAEHLPQETQPAESTIMTEQDTVIPDSVPETQSCDSTAAAEPETDVPASDTESPAGEAAAETADASVPETRSNDNPAAAEAEIEVPPSKTEPAAGESAPELPECVRIMQNVIERSAENENGSLIFTVEEMYYLASDPLFEKIDPKLYAEIKKALDSG
jgi:hypothetical protein